MFFSLDDSMLLCGISFCSWVMMNKRVARNLRCMCGRCFSLVLKKTEFAAGPKNGRNEDHNTHVNLMTRLILREPNYCRIFCDCVDRHLVICSRFLLQQQLKEIRTRSTHSQSAFIHYATSFGHRKFF